MYFYSSGKVKVDRQKAIFIYWFNFFYYQKPFGSGVFACFGFQISLDPDPVSARILGQKKSTERALKVIYQKKT